MDIDIDRFTEAELIALNHRIIARLRFFSQMRAHADMLEFRIGERVAFRSPEAGQIDGTLTRYNRKTVTVLAEDGRQWNVSPSLLRKVIVAEPTHSKGSNVIQLGKG
jgi:hypothetical protein